MRKKLTDQSLLSFQIRAKKSRRSYWNTTEASQWKRPSLYNWERPCRVQSHSMKGIATVTNRNVFMKSTRGSCESVEDVVLCFPFTRQVCFSDLPERSKFMLGSLCTGRMRSSSSFCRPHSGLLRHAWEVKQINNKSTITQLVYSVCDIGKLTNSRHYLCVCPVIDDEIHCQ